MPATQDIYQVELRDIADEPTSLAAHSGKVLLLVNVASECGFTSHYEGLQELHERFHERGLVVCGFHRSPRRGRQPLRAVHQADGPARGEGG